MMRGRQAVWVVVLLALAIASALLYLRPGLLAQDKRGSTGGSGRGGTRYSSIAEWLPSFGGDHQPGAASPKSSVKVYKEEGLEDKYCTYSRNPIADIRGPKTYTLCSYAPSFDQTISRHIQNQHAVWEENTVRHGLKFLAEEDRKTDAEKISLVDIGCNVGTYSVVAAVLGFQVLSVDAMNTSLAIVATGLSKNNVRDRVTLINNGVGDLHQRLAVMLHNRSVGLSHVLPVEDPKVNRPVPGFRKQSEVDSVVFDDLAPHVRTRRVFLKMDIEGAEGRALRQSEKFFREVNVVGVLMEWTHVKKSTDDRDFILRLFHGLGYRPFNNPWAATPLTGDPMRWPSDYFWLKK